MFVYLLLYQQNKKTDTGYYLDIGAGDPQSGNNSFFFEKEFGWKGFSIELTDKFQTRWSSLRTNPLLVHDALTVDYTTVLADFPKVMDYLSLDTDGF